MKTEQMHLDESAILHLVDEDAHPMQLDLWTRHVLECDACAERLRTQRRNADLVRVALIDIQLPPGFPDAPTIIAAAGGRAAPPGRVRATARRDRPWLRAAALVLVLLVPVVLVSPLRAAAVDWFRQGWIQVTDLVGWSAGDAVSGSDAGEARGYTLWFTTTGGVLEIVVDHRQRIGELVVSRSTGTEVSLEVEDGADEALLTGRGLRIRNAASSGASYRVAVPASVDRVRVRLGDGRAETITSAELQAGWRTELR